MLPHCKMPASRSRCARSSLSSSAIRSSSRVHSYRFKCNPTDLDAAQVKTCIGEELCNNLAKVTSAVSLQLWARLAQLHS